MLAAKILEDQNIQVECLCFVSSFFDEKKALVAAEGNSLKLRVLDIKKELLQIVKKPPSGHGKNLNPCIDCHSLMIKIAGKIAREECFHIVASGEVLGQRPFSQNREALRRVAKLSGVDILRPLSAQLLEETEVEKKGFIDRSKLLAISGRSRKEQQKLLQKYNIKNYSSPAGGCVLTDGGYCLKLKKMLKFWPDCSLADIDLLSAGRIIWLKFNNNKILTIVGRHREDNLKIQKLVKKGDFVLELKEIRGPLLLLRSTEKIISKKEEIKIHIPYQIDLDAIEKKNHKEVADIFEIAAILSGYYSSKARGKECLIKIDKI